MFRLNLVGASCSESKMLVWCIDPALKWPLFLGNRWWRTKRQAGSPRAVGQPGRGGAGQHLGGSNRVRRGYPITSMLLGFPGRREEGRNGWA